MAELVKTFLDSMPGSEAECDECFIAYLAGALGEEDAELHDLDEQLAGSCTSYGAMPLDTRMTALIDLYHKVLSAQSVQQPQQNTCEATTTKTAELEQHPAAQHACRQSDTGPGPGSEASRAAQACAADNASVDQLLALCPVDVSRAYVSHILSTTFGRDVQAAANFLLECDKLLERDRQYSRQAEAELLRQQEEQELLERSKKELVARFALQEIKALPKNKKAGAAPVSLPGPQAEVPKVRYLNGMPVTVRKGEKYVLEATKEEWDGGSKGKVYTKGKRGKGFA